MKLHNLIGGCLLFSVLMFSKNITFATENPEEAEVKKAIAKMFDGMRAGDSTMVKAVFYEDARLQTVYVKEGKPLLHTGSIQKFLDAVGTPHDKVFDEKILSYDIKVDGHFATAWTEYQFFLGEEFSHCGVNAFHLFKSDDGWKITQITDTRRKEDCE